MAEKRAEKPKFSCPSGVQILENPLKTPNRRTQAFDRRTQAFNRRTQAPFACVTCSPKLSLEGILPVQAAVLRLMDLRLMDLRLRLLMLRHPLQVWILRHPPRHLILLVLILLRRILTCPPLRRIQIQCVQ